MNNDLIEIFDDSYGTKFRKESTPSTINNNISSNNIARLNMWWIR